MTTDDVIQQDCGDEPRPRRTGWRAALGVGAAALAVSGALLITSTGPASAEPESKLPKSAACEGHGVV